jgi:hypothetical protein
MANAYKKSGNIAQYSANVEKSQKLTLEDANRQATALMANADTMPLMDYAKAAANIFSSDSLPFSIKSVSPDPAGSDGVMLTVQNDQNGNQRSVTFKDSATLSRALQSMYQPETFNKIATTRAESAARVAEEIAKNPYHNVSPGAIAMDKRTGKPVLENDTGYVPARDADGNPIIGADGQPAIVHPTSGRGAGAGKSSAAPKVGEVPKAIELGLKGNEGLIPAATSIASILQQNNPNMPPDTAHALAIEAAKGQNIKTQFDPKTGMFTRHYTDISETDPKTGQPLRYATNKTYLVDANEYSANSSAVTKEQASAAVKQLETQSPEVFKQYAAAVTPEGAKAFDAKLKQTWQTMQENATSAFEKAQAAEAAAQKAGDSKAASAAHAQKVKIDAELEDAFAKVTAEGRKADLVRQFYKAQGADAVDNKKPPLSVAERLAAPGGLGSAVPLDAARRAADVEAQTKQRAEASAAEKTARAAANAKAMDEIKGLTPDVIRQITDDKLARDLYSKYNLQLDASQRTALQQRMYMLRRQALMNSQ